MKKTEISQNSGSAVKGRGEKRVTDVEREAEGVGGEAREGVGGRRESG